MVELLELGTKKKREILSVLRKNLIDLRKSLGHLYEKNEFQGKESKKILFSPGEGIFNLLYRNPAVMLEETDPALVEGDPRDFESILENLVLNAMEAGAETIRVSCRKTGSYLQLEVTDDGPGIAIEDLPFIFMPGFSTKKGFNANSGYGLYDVYLKALRNGWKLGVIPLERGCKFYLKMKVIENTKDPQHDRLFPHRDS